MSTGGVRCERSEGERDGLVGAAMIVCGSTRGRKGEAKRTRWWNEEVKSAVRKKKVLYKRLLNTGTEEARQLYKEAIRGKENG